METISYRLIVNRKKNILVILPYKARVRETPVDVQFPSFIVLACSNQGEIYPCIHLEIWNSISF